MVEGAAGDEVDPDGAAAGVDGFVSAAVAGAASGALVEGAACAGLSDVSGFFPPSRKSVTYQPDPFS